MGKRTLTDLVDTADPAWPLVSEWLSGASAPVEVLPMDQGRAERTLLDMQITTRSPMGAIVYHTGGILIDDGWLRILGSGHDRLPRTVSSWNAVTLPIQEQRLPGGCLFADDVIGGFFALNGGAFEAQPGHVQYFAPDTLNWEDMKMSYSQFIQWSCGAGLAQFYQSFRWDGWRDEVKALNGDKAFSFYPFLWANEPSLPGRSRKAVPVEEVWGVQMDTRLQMMAQQ